MAASAMGGMAWPVRSAVPRSARTATKMLRMAIMMFCGWRRCLVTVLRVFEREEDDGDGDDDDGFSDEEEAAGVLGVVGVAGEDVCG